MLPTDRRRGSSWSCAALIFLALAAPGMGRAQAAPPLPAAAQAALDKGVIAARLPDYLDAIRLFEQARKAAPDASIIYLNLGLAESQVAGRELRAIAWLAAYLAANPDAPNSAAVKAEISALDTRSQANIAGFIGTLQRVAIEKTPALAYSSSEDLQDSRLGYVVRLWLATGDITSALGAVKLFAGDDGGGVLSPRSQALHAIAIAQARRGDLTAAQRTADLLRGAYSKAWKTTIARNMIIAQAESGDILGAKKRMHLVQGRDRDRSLVLAGIAAALAARGDAAGAAAMFSEGQRVVDGVDAAQRPAAQSEFDEQSRPPPAHARAATADWLARLDDASQSDAAALKTAPFLNFADHLKSFPPSNHPERVFAQLQTTGGTIVKAQNLIDEMLKMQFAK